MLAHAGHYNDTDTGAHIWRMAAYASALARACGWDAERSAQLELAAPMHGTGKLGMPQAILRKPGPLDAQEWVVMKTHPRIGHDILSMSEAPVFRMAAEISLRHHEKWDGSGYPDLEKACQQRPVEACLQWNLHDMSVAWRHCQFAAVLRADVR
jgi:putative two-component system response regulator